MIRSTFTAMPARRVVLAAKAATTAAFVFPAALLCNVIGFEVGQRILAGRHIQVAIGHPGVPQAMVLGAVAVSLVAVIGVGLGGLIRHTAGAITALSLIAIIDADEPDHVACMEALDQIVIPLVTTWPAFTEAMYLLARAGGIRAQQALWRLVQTDRLVIADLSQIG